MERRMRPLLAAAALVLALAACSNPIDIYETVADEVKAATGRYLVVSAATPAANATDVSPGSTITVTFDRAIDPATLEGAIAISPVVEFTYAYDEATLTLTISPAMLNGGETYTVTIADTVLGVDGSTLRAAYILTFRTANVPYGTFAIISTYANSQAGFTNTLSVTLKITANTLAEKMCYSEKADLSDATWVAIGAAELFPLTSGTDGTRTVYMRFADSSVTNLSEIVSATIVLDTVKPTMSGGSLPYLNVYTFSSGLQPGATASDSLSGIARANWAGTGVTFSDLSAVDPVISITGGDGSYTAKCYVMDNAGNSSDTATITITKDTVLPNAPTVALSGTTPYTSDTATFTFTTGDGYGTYRYRVRSDDLTYTDYTATTSTSCTVSVDYGSNRLYLSERDAAGNWSSSVYAAYFRYPTFLQPIEAATSVSLTPTLRYAQTYNSRISYTIYLGTSSKYMDVLVSGRSTITYTIPSGILDNGTRYYWKYVSSSRYTSPVYTFETVSK